MSSWISRRDAGLGGIASIALAIFAMRSSESMARSLPLVILYDVHIDFRTDDSMILAWRCKWCSRQVRGGRGFPGRKPVAVPTSPAAPPAQPEGGVASLSPHAENVRVSGSLRSARRTIDRDLRMTKASECAPRRERLRVRLTAEEAAYISELAAQRAPSVSEYVRARLLRGSGLGAQVRRRILPTESAAVIRELSAIGADLQRLVAIVRASGSVPSDELGDCVARVQAAIAGLGP
jgi:hypothetical protein